MNEERPSIPEFFAGRALFITGATGFMGKVLVEKLLRSCPDLGTIYVLLRAKKSAAPEERLRELTKQPLFDRLRMENPAALDKLRPVSGDVTELGLGLSPEDRAQLQTEVSVVFHSAASVRFDDSFSDAVIVNVRGTREVLELALGMRRLVAVVHLSTAYSNCNRIDVDEQLYPPPGDWRKMIQLAEDRSNDLVMDCITPKVIGSLPNTYTYAKALGEHVVNDFRSRLPVVIVRPSIVTMAAREPYTGWVDNLNGPMGLFVGGVSGILGTWSIFGHEELALDYVPVDSAIKSAICIAWHTAHEKSSDELVVYNCAHLTEPIAQKQFIVDGIRMANETPTIKCAWFPSANICMTTSWAKFWVGIVFCHMLPAYFMDAALEYNGQKPMFKKVYRRLYTSTKMVAYFVLTGFNFRNQRFLAVGERIRPEDRADFGFTEVFRWQDGFQAEAWKGLRRSLLDDPPSTIPKAKARLQRLFWLDRGLKSVFCLALVYTVLTSATVQAVVTSSLSVLVLFFWGAT